MKYQIKEFETFGRYFYRVLESSDGQRWSLVAGSLDYDLRQDAELALKLSAQKNVTPSK